MAPHAAMAADTPQIDTADASITASSSVRVAPMLPS